MKKLLTIITIMLLLISASACQKKETEINNEQQISINKEGKYPTVWDSALLYPDYDSFKKDLNKLEDYTKVFESFRGKLNTVDGLYGYICATYDEDFNRLYDKLGAFANFGLKLYPMDQLFINCSNEYNDVSAKLYDSTSFFSEEMSKIPYEKRLALFNDDKLKEYADVYYYCLYEDMSSMSEEELELYNTATMSQGRMSYLFNIFTGYEIPSVEYTLKDGTVLYLDDSNIYNYFRKDYDFETKKGIYEAWWSNCAKYANTLAYILETHLIEQYSNTLLNGFTNTKEYALLSLGFTQDIIEIITNYAKNYVDYNKQFLSAYGRRDNSEKYYTFEKYLPLSNYKEDEVNYDDAIDDIVASLNILGDEYIDTFLEIINSNQVDVYPNEQKSSGSYENGNYAGLDPFVMLNYENDPTTISDIAHEMGHACYDKLTHENQKMYHWHISTFTHEVASLTNEILYYSYKIDNAKNDDEKLYYLELLLKTWSSNMYNSCFWEEMECYVNEVVESGGHLTADDITAKWLELSPLYYGDGIDCGESGAYRWTTLTTFYNYFYEYSYSTSICYATVIAQNILNNEANATENYINFLKAGGSLTPTDALMLAGIDIYSADTYDQAFNFFGEKVAEFNNLLKK